MINKLYAIQEELNERILLEHNLNKAELLNDKYLAFLVELGELANETRCFKYWSLKGPSDKSIIIEEFSDVLHFLLTIGLELEKPKLVFYNQESDLGLSDLFLSMYNDLNIVKNQGSSFVYLRMYNTLMQIGKKLGFSEEDIYNSYLSKNEKNHLRQDLGY